jgi:hypothetical protein
MDEAIIKVLQADARNKGNFDRVFATDDPVSVDDVPAASLVMLGPAWTHTGKGNAQSTATEIVGEVLTRCRASQRNFRNTLFFVAADAAGLANAREVMRKALAWESIAKDDRVRGQITTAQVKDTEEKAKHHRGGADQAVRVAWSHIFFPVQSAVPGKPFDLEHSLLTSRERGAIPRGVYDKLKADGIVFEQLGPETLWHKLGPIWPNDRPYLTLAEVAEWFAKYTYLPKLRDKPVLEGAIRAAVARLDPPFGYADGYDEATGGYLNLIWAKHPPDIAAPGALLVRAAEAQAQLAEAARKSPESPGPVQGPGRPDGAERPSAPEGPAEPQHRRPCRFCGSVEIDMTRPVKAFESILNAVVIELQRAPGAKVRLSLEIEGEAPDGFAEEEVSVVRDNAKQLKFQAEATGFE